MIITQERAVELARSVVDARIKIQVHGELAMIDNNLMGGIELAFAVTSGYVEQLSRSGERRLMETHNRIVALLETMRPKVVPTVTGPIEGTTPDGRTYTLTRTGPGACGPVLTGEAITSPMEPEDRFIVTGAVWRDDICETALCVFGHWDSDGPTEGYPISMKVFNAKWEPKN
jgi:hypothetical protein